MNKTFDLEAFIKTFVIERQTSLFANDLQRYDSELRQEIDGKKVLVIGGAGTIGSSYIKALLKFKPATLYVVDINENNLTELTRDIRSNPTLNVPENYKTYPIDFGQPVFEKMLTSDGPFDIVANFAAHKHVRSEKDHFSIEAMIENNVFKARRLLDLLAENPPNHFFCVSTDKAANPVNIMGASKKLMEEVILAYSKKIPITTARFANVAFSNGSLLFGFLERLMKKQPFSSPLDIKRYFVSPEESGQICLLACILGKSGQIFFPKLNEEKMKTFSSIAENLLKEMGFEPDYCTTEEEAKNKKIKQGSNNYPVYFFQSNTSGEKSFEEFFTATEDVDFESFSGLGIIKDAPQKDIKVIDDIFIELRRIFASDSISKTQIVEVLTGFLPEFSHIEKGKNLDQSM